MEFNVAHQLVKPRYDPADFSDTGPPHARSQALDFPAKLLSQPPHATDLRRGLGPRDGAFREAPQQFALVRATVRWTRCVDLAAALLMGGTGQREPATLIIADDQDPGQM
jgi:hypothetical protein